ncbi:MAG: tol-pal system protein YbgF [Sandaracinaceae bacterium]|nr:tol-pal system protein YbgF [Sandaracinaceae bacterium]
MNRRLRLIVFLALGGCATAPTPVARVAPDVSASSEASDVESEAFATLRAQNRELSAQLGLARAEAAELRDEVAAMREDAARRVVTLSPAPAACEEQEAPVAEAEPVDTGPRPVLRLYGTAPAPLPEVDRPAGRARGVAMLPGPEAPAWVGPPPAATARLPVYNSAGDDPTAGVPAIPLTPVDVRGGPVEAVPAATDAASQEYRAALAAFSQRRLPDATAAFERFVAQHPDHPYADNAMYWRAEIDYTRRDYAAALSRFSRLIERFPRGNKVPDALLRIGLCYERMGQRDRARRVFSRLRQQYPDTVAARMASREDA